MMPKKSICAEIGVWKGTFSLQIIKATKPEKLHLIDPWKYQTGFGERLYGGLIAKSQFDMDEIYNEVQKLFHGNAGIKIHRDFSSNVAAIFSKEYFDWIYVDGNHYYDYVLRDLVLYFPKIKKGGYLTGDDYYWTSEELNGDFPVQRAVQDFVRQKHDEIDFMNIIEGQFVIRKK